ncbi:MAG: hypothetical protein E7566_07710 [Ruminococcaceae bacterium]|nr:hypothetical protein [Oscillospiraceae bacterium]
MEESVIYRSPIICYEVSKNQNAYDISVYLEGYKNSKCKNHSCEIKDFSEDKTKALDFAFMLSRNCALPIHIPELTEEFLSF